MLQDTREDAPANTDESLLVFDPVEVLGDDESVKEGPRPHKTIRLKLAGNSANGRSQFEILGIPTADYDFI